MNESAVLSSVQTFKIPRLNEITEALVTVTLEPASGAVKEGWGKDESAPPDFRLGS